VARRKKFRLPRKLALLPHLPHTGHLKITGRDGDNWVTHYDVKTPEGTYVLDIHPLTNEQIKRWTGVDLRAEERGNDD
jgi:hypothetical protein